MKTSGIVVHGKGEGRKIGFPTANIVNNIALSPGIYAGSVIFNEQTFKSALYVGKNSDDTLESHLIGFDGDLYGKTIFVKVDKKVREDMSFETLDELRNQINTDIEKIKNLS